MERTECAECGLDADVRVELGDHAAGTEDVPTLYICLPCLKRAVAEAEAAVRDAEWERRAGDEP
jgi:hypothetical protein